MYLMWCVYTWYIYIVPCRTKKVDFSKKQKHNRKQNHKKNNSTGRVTRNTNNNKNNTLFSLDVFFLFFLVGLLFSFCFFLIFPWVWCSSLFLFVRSVFYSFVKPYVLCVAGVIMIYTQYTEYIFVFIHMMSRAHVLCDVGNNTWW